MNTLLIVARAVHFASAMLLFGGLALLLFVAEPAWRSHGGDIAADRLLFLRRVASSAWWVLIASVASALAWLMCEACEMSGQPLEQALNQNTLALVLEATTFGRLWIVRLILATVLALLILRLARAGSEDGRQRFAWVALVVAAAYLASLAWAGHAAAGLESQREIQLGADVVHLLAAGGWVGALPGLVLLLGSRPQLDVASRAAQRFSTLGVISVGALLFTGIVNARYLVGTIPALIGTHYGRLLLAKLTLFLIMLCLATVNRTVLTPRLGLGAAAALTTLRRNALLEIIAGLGIISIVGALGVTIPGAHQSPVWPFEHTLEWPSAKPGATYVALVALAAIAFAGVATIAAALLRRRVWLLAGGLAVIATTLAISVWLLAEPAYPTSYASPPLPYATSPIARGATVYAQNCAQCHGEDGRGNGPAADSMATKPVDLTEHASHHRIGDLYWWIAHGIPGTPMPGFGKQLSDDEIWSVVRYLHALSDAAAVEPAADGEAFSRWIAAPDFNFEVGAHAQESLMQQRDTHLVLLVLYTLPQSAQRLRAVEAEQQAYVDAGVRVIALPMTPDTHARVEEDGPDGNSIFALGQPDVANTYAMFARPSESAPSASGHAEFLIDRSGYLRGRWRGPGVDKRTTNILERVNQLSREPPRPAPTGEHQHSH